MRREAGGRRGIPWMKDGQGERVLTDPELTQLWAASAGLAPVAREFARVLVLTACRPWRGCRAWLARSRAWSRGRCGRQHHGAATRADQDQEQARPPRPARAADGAGTAGARHDSTRQVRR